MTSLRAALLFTAAALGIAAPRWATAEPLKVPAPLHSTGDQPVVSQGQSLVNHGLVGVGRLASDAVDFIGDSLGSFSGMAIDPASWRRDGDAYVGRLYSLPDRGLNAPENNEYSDYEGRVITYDLRFEPGRSLTFKPTGSGIRLTDFDGKPTTGADPGAGTITQNRHVLPSPAKGELGAGQVSLDAEALVRAPDGSLYVGDEYAAAIYHFTADGRMDGVIGPDAALLPMTKGKLNFNSSKAPDTGRRNNQGVEAVSVTPDGRKLVAVLQSATLQDSSASKNQANRAVTRIMVYDIEKEATPSTPSAVYALELPVIASKGDGAIDKTAAQSEIVALDDHRFLVLARDSVGLGCKCKGPEVFKAVLLVDVTGATNLAGTEYETSTKPIAPAEGEANRLLTAIKPAQSQVLVNLLNPGDLAKFGMNLANARADAHTLSEKWEAMALVPALDPAHPDDAFLFIGNDNDFLTRHGIMQGKGYDAEVDNDTVLLAYRLTLPGVSLKP